MKQREYRTYPYPGLSLILAIFCLITAVLFVSQVSAICRWEHCREIGEAELPMDDDVISEDEAIAVELCQALDNHAKCLKSSARSCRGNLGYYSYLKGLTRVMERKNCSEIILKAANRRIPDELVTNRPYMMETSTDHSIMVPAFHGCSTVKLHDHIAFCGLFGNSHLVTHEGRFQTCRIQGAYPLIENRHLAIQVSSHPNAISSSLHPITAISKIVIMIKSSECSEERKTYEAYAGYLPAYFSDSTSESDSVKLISRIPLQFMEMRILHLKTIIYIRQVGSSLSLSVRLPASLLRNEMAVNYHLCSGGCPENEIVSRPAVLRDQSLRSVQEAEDMCRGRNISGPFLEACLFDAAVTSELSSVMGAEHAQLDWERLAPVDARTAEWAGEPRRGFSMGPWTLASNGCPDSRLRYLYYFLISICLLDFVSTFHL